MKTFEQQLADSARRLRDADNYRLPAPRRPHRRLVWGWLTTPAAAAIGLLAGINLPRQAAMLAPQVAEVRVTDTIIRDHTVRDTIFVPAPALRTRLTGHPDKKTAARTREKLSDTLQAFPSQGSNVLCDGVDYSLLVRL